LYFEGLVLKGKAERLSNGQYRYIVKNINFDEDLKTLIGKLSKTRFDLQK
jgi:hypothetical protein